MSAHPHIIASSEQHLRELLGRCSADVIEDRAMDLRVRLGTRYLSSAPTGHSTGCSPPDVVRRLGDQLECESLTRSLELQWIRLASGKGFCFEPYNLAEKVEYSFLTNDDDLIREVLAHKSVPDAIRREFDERRMRIADCDCRIWSAIQRRVNEAEPRLWPRMRLKTIAVAVSFATALSIALMVGVVWSSRVVPTIHEDAARSAPQLRLVAFGKESDVLSPLEGSVSTKDWSDLAPKDEWKLLHICLTLLEAQFSSARISTNGVVETAVEAKKVEVQRLLDLGVCDGKLKEFESAESALMQSLALCENESDPWFVNTAKKIHNNLAADHIERRQFDKARFYLQFAAQSQAAIYNRLLIASHDKNQVECERLWKQLLECAPVKDWDLQAEMLGEDLDDFVFFLQLIKSKVLPAGPLDLNRIEKELARIERNSDRIDIGCQERLRPDTIEAARFGAIREVHPAVFAPQIMPEHGGSIPKTNSRNPIRENIA